jgi:hypothetical protein
VARLIYMAITSLDGYIEDDKGHYDWAMPDDEVFAFINDFERPVGTYLYGLGRQPLTATVGGGRPRRLDDVLPARACTAAARRASVMRHLREEAHECDFRRWVRSRPRLPPGWH